MPKCADCRHVHIEVDQEDGERLHRCGYAVPFWVPLPILDYRSWVKSDDGEKCPTFSAKTASGVGATTPTANHD